MLALLACPFGVCHYNETRMIDYSVCDDDGRKVTRSQSLNFAEVGKAKGRKPDVVGAR